VFSWKFWNC